MAYSKESHWHNLIHNPNDLPHWNDTVIVKLDRGNGIIAFSTATYLKGFIGHPDEWLVDYNLKYNNILEWHELPNKDKDAEIYIGPTDKEDAAVPFIEEYEPRFRVYCPKCGKTLIPQAYCGNCGQKINWDAVRRKYEDEYLDL